MTDKKAHAVTKDTAEATRCLFDLLFGEDAEAAALELTQLPSGLANTPAGELLEEMAEAEREVFEFEVRQKAAELRGSASVQEPDEHQPRRIGRKTPLLKESAEQNLRPARKSGASQSLIGPQFPEGAPVLIAAKGGGSSLDDTSPEFVNVNRATFCTLTTVWGQVEIQDDGKSVFVQFPLGGSTPPGSIEAGKNSYRLVSVSGEPQLFRAEGLTPDLGLRFGRKHEISLK